MPQLFARRGGVREKWKGRPSPIEPPPSARMPHVVSGMPVHAEVARGVKSNGSTAREEEAPVAGGPLQW